MTSSASVLAPDRLIWLPLFALMAVALVADQARANLHAEARSTAVAAAAPDEPETAEAWCRMHLDALVGDEALGFDRGYGLESSSASGRTLPVSHRRAAARGSWSADGRL